MAKEVTGDLPSELMMTPEMQEEENKARIMLETRATALFKQELGDNLTWEQAPDTIKYAYYTLARGHLLDDMVKQKQASTDYEEAETEAAAARNDVTIGHNSPELFMFTDKQGKEIFTIHRNTAGDVDVTLNAETSYTEAAKTLLQITFEQGTKKAFMDFGRALEWMKKDYIVESAAHPGATLEINRMAEPLYVKMHGSNAYKYEIAEAVMWNDWAVVGKKG